MSANTQSLASPKAGENGGPTSRRKYIPYLFVSPFFILFISFFLGPTLYALFLSFQRWSSVGAPEYMGLRNFERLFSDRIFIQAIENTLVYAASSLFIVCPLALLLALALNSKQVMFKTFWRAIYFAPIVTSTVAISLTFLTLYNREFGLLNEFLGWFGVEPVDWLGREMARYAIIGVIIWRWTGLTSIYFLAGLQTIPQDLYEAASIDGANAIQRFWNITIPQLRPVMLFVSVIVTIGSLQIFDEPQILTEGGPANASISVVQYLYSRGIGNLRYGYASAIGTVLFAMIFILSLVQLQIFRSNDEGA